MIKKIYNRDTQIRTLYHPQLLGNSRININRFIQGQNCWEEVRQTSKIKPKRLILTDWTAS